MNTKILPIIIAAFLAGTSSYAVLIPISLDRSVSISGQIADSSYNTTISSNSLGLFEETLSDSLTVTSVIPPDPIFGNGMTVVHVESTGSQTSALSPDGFTLHTLLDAQMQRFLDPAGSPYTNRHVGASFGFSYTFQVPEPLSYSLAGSLMRFQGHGVPGLPQVELFLSSSDPFLLPSSSGPISHSGILLPGTYTFGASADGLAIVDPLGNSAFAQLDLDFRTTSVPEPGSSLALLAAGFGLLITLQRAFYSGWHSARLSMSI
jgi:hypothetical protein